MLKYEQECLLLIKSKIYDSALPTKVRKELEEHMELELLKIDPNKSYRVDVLFDAHVYETDDEFYSFPITRGTPALRQGRKKLTESEIKREKVHAVLSEQLDGIIEVLEAAGMYVEYAYISGEECFVSDSVWVLIHLLEPEQDPGQKKNQSKAKCRCIMPSRSGFYRNLAKAGEMVREWRKREQESEEQEKNERRQHTPHFVCAEELFTEIAQAVHPSDCAQSTLYKEMLYKTAVQTSDWPLTIKSRRIKTDDNTSIDKDTKFDCPEYMIYTQQTTGEWSIEKIGNLISAQDVIVKHGYNLKTTGCIVVLHHVKTVPYTLFKNTAEGLVMVTPEEARGEKKLFLSWNK